MDDERMRIGRTASRRSNCQKLPLKRGMCEHREFPSPKQMDNMLALYLSYLSFIYSMPAASCMRQAISTS